MKKKAVPIRDRIRKIGGNNNNNAMKTGRFGKLSYSVFEINSR